MKFISFLCSNFIMYCKNLYIVRYSTAISILSTYDDNNGECRKERGWGGSSSRLVRHCWFRNKFTCANSRCCCFVYMS